MMRGQARLPILLATFVALAACAGSSQSAAPPAGSSSPPRDTAPAQAGGSSDSPAWLKSDSTSRTAELSLEVTRPAGASSALLNGYRAGEARVIVPVGWTVKWNWRNVDTSAPHSLVVMVQREKIPLEGGRPAFTNGMTRMVIEGLPAGQTDQTTFEAEEAGWYWLMCGVPEHGLAGEWIELQVSPDARVAGVRLKQGGT